MNQAKGPFSLQGREQWQTKSCMDERMARQIGPSLPPAQEPQDSLLGVESIFLFHFRDDDLGWLIAVLLFGSAWKTETQNLGGTDPRRADPLGTWQNFRGEMGSSQLGWEQSGPNMSRLFFPHFCFLVLSHTCPGQSLLPPSPHVH